ncbi:MAG: RHS repeat protein, partial [Ferruginibacter sp.]|nr:RHS repeat protein [Ferruginibacter sp.]
FFTQAPSYLPLMNASVNNYEGMATSPEALGMWKLAYGEVRYKNTLDDSLRRAQYLNAPNNPPPYAGFTAAENEQAWQVFKGLYAAKRNSFVDEYIAISRPLANNEENDLIAQHYRLWFPRNANQTAAQNQWSWWQTTTGGGPTGAGSGGGTPTPPADQCSSYINMWKNQLLQCEALANSADKDVILTAITTRMQAVCANGTNASNTYGSSNVAPSTPASVTDRNFEDVIKNVFIQYNIINGSGIYSDNYCNPFVIEWPKPYGLGPKMVGGEMTSQVDSCKCKAFAKVKAEATANNYNPAVLASLNLYLQSQYGETLTQGMFDGLQHCDELISINCITKDTILLYNCIGPVPNCPGAKLNNSNTNRSVPPTTCVSFDLIIQGFISVYGTNPENCKNLFTEYFNHECEVSYTWEQITSLYEKLCGKRLPVCNENIAFNCDELQGVIDQYSGQPQQLGIPCQSSFTTFFNNHFGTSYNWFQIVAIYLNNCGITLDVCGPAMVFDCKELSGLIDQYHEMYLGQQPECQELFVQLFNNHYGTSYSWGEIVTIYFESCGITLDICDIPVTYDCTELQSIISDYYTVYGYNTSGFKCQNFFTSFFNTHFGTTYTWNQIVAIYMNSCGITLDICSPTFCQKTCTVTICDTTYQVYILPQPQPLPDFLKCGYTSSSHCVSCAQLSNYTAEYKIKFAPAPNTAPIFTGTNLSPAEVQNNMNYARFINYRTGFQYDWLQYSQAASAATPACNMANYATNGSALQNVICGDPHPLADTITVVTDSPCVKVYTMAVTLAQQIMNIRTQYLLQQFDDAYKAKCLAAKDIESFTVNYNTSEYHYTLYYYDMAGSLVKTVPPKGVNPDFSLAFTNSTKAARNAGTYLTTPITRPHTFATNYRYNSLGQVTAQNTPDANTSNFWYDALGRLVVSQNAQQLATDKYSYTLYDPLGRITEVGQKPQAANSMDQSVSQNNTNLLAWINTSGGTKEQMTVTNYDYAYPPLAPGPTYITQQNLRNRVSFTYTKNLDTDPLPAAATFYSYDIHGNVDKLVQDYKEATQTMPPGNRYKTLAYNYDLISGKVNNVNYQDGYADAFYHRYSYDAENRLLAAETSRDKIIWERDAAYNYYKHGPLARTELGQQSVQGIDYAYTIHGWLKGINQTSLDAAGDIGLDGFGPPTPTVAKDALSFALHYYDEVDGANTYMDYKAIGAPNTFAKPGAAGNMLSLYNGNIAAMTVNNAGLLKASPSSTNSMALLYRYKYDQLNRIVSMQAYKGLDAATNQWNAVSVNDYRESTSYDPNGNILSYNRNGAPGANMPEQMDELTYDYIAGKNQLLHVADNPAYTGNYTEAANGTEDINNQTNANNYTYDLIGNLIGDDAESINNINWNVYGKIKSIEKATGVITYQYDAAGNRISKKVGNKTTLYARDASGNVMSVYESLNSAAAVQKEVHLYGSSRLGMLTELTLPPVNISLVAGFGTAGFSTFTRAEKIFELSNHLGNVLVTISDKKLAVDSDGNGVVDYYNADVVTA